jgi:hypothetical protein
LWRLWRLLDDAPPLLRYLIAGGFLIRAFAAQLLFWISYLRLPYGSSLQLGHGLWFFAVDASYYLLPAATAASNAPLGILQIPMSYPSVGFTRVLALFLWLFGASTAIAILLNVTVYLGMSLLIVRWAARHKVPAKITALPLFAIGYLPSWILWALQPMKDAYFCFLIVLFAFAVDSFVAAWKRPRGMRAASIAGTALLMLFATHLLASVRWYYAAMAIVAAFLVCASILFVRQGGRELALRAVVLLAFAFVMTQIFVLSAGPYCPRPIATLMQPWKLKKVEEPAGVRGVVNVVEESRRNLDRYTSAGTVIRSGHRIEDTPAPAQIASSSSNNPALAARPSRPQSAIATTATSQASPANTPPPARTAVVKRPVNPFADDAPATAASGLPRTPKQRLLTGTAALLLPRSIAVKLELVSIGGGRGMMWFAELDTILFDIVILAVIGIVLASLRRGAWRDPFVWYLLGMSVAIAGAIAYTISNYGTLLRHRGMLVATAVLLAVAVRRCVDVRRSNDDTSSLPPLGPSEMPAP